MPRKANEKKGINSGRPRPNIQESDDDNDTGLTDADKRPADVDAVTRDETIDDVLNSVLSSSKVSEPGDEEEEDDDDESDAECVVAPLSQQLSSTAEDADASPVAAPTTTPGATAAVVGSRRKRKKEQSTEEEDGVVGETSSSAVKRKKRKKRFRLTPTSAKPKKRREANAAKSKQQTDGVDETNEEGAATPAEASPAPASVDCTTMPLPSRQRLGEYSPLQLLLDYLLRYLCAKDPEHYFWFPVTDKIAPDYSTVVAKPMDFYKMRLQIDDGSYKTLDDFKQDVDLIRSNAILYNEQTTVYFHAAKKLKHVSEHLFSQDNLSFLYNTLPFMSEITATEIGMDLALLNTKPKILTGPKPVQRYREISDDMTAEEIISATRSASDRLAARKAKSHLAFLHQNDDGSTTMNIMTGGGCDEDKKRLTLGHLVAKLSEGLPGLSQFKEDKSNLVTTVSPLNYGGYSSFGPSYDSTWANVNKAESRLLMAYGDDDDTVEYATGLSAFAVDAGLSLARTVHGLLDVLTDGRHSLLVGRPPPAPSVVAVAPPAQHTPDESKIDFESLRSLSNLGFDTSFMDGLKHQLESIDQDATTKTLRKTGLLLADLEMVQTQRLSRPPNFTLTHTDGVASEEITIAGATLNSLKQLIPSVSPGRLVDARAVHRAIGVDDDDCDMDFLRQFIDVPDDGEDSAMQL